MQNGSFVTMKTVTFQIRSSEKYLFGFNRSNYVVKTEFFKKSSQTLILATCYNSTLSYFKINLNNVIQCLLSISKIMNL